MSFRARPLTWLFFAATACLDAIALATDNESEFANALALGQLFVASGWLVLGQSHRLAKAAVVVATIALLTAPDFFIPRLRGGFYQDLVWPHILGMLIVMGGATVLATVISFAVLSLRRKPFRRSEHVRWQFPVVELFGWTIVVAAASIGLRLADFSLIVDPRSLLLGWALVFVAGGVMTAITQIMDEYSTSEVAVVLLFVLIAAHAWYLGTELARDEWPTAAGSLTFVTIWAAVVRIDRASHKASLNDPTLRSEDDLA